LTRGTPPSSANVTIDVDIPIKSDTPNEETSAEAGEAAAIAPEIAQAIEERDQLRDRLLRTQAEFDNYRKRVDRERLETIERAAESVLRDLLPVIDDLERALSADATNEAAESYRRGVELIHRQLTDLLTRRGVKPIETLGKDFDPHLHQAVASEAVPGAREGEVVQELRRGYTLGDRLLRPAMVKVAQA
jgi:molecular chaperone GrpE